MDNKKLFKFEILLIFVVFIFSVHHMFSIKLKEPVFLKSYIQKDINSIKENILYTQENRGMKISYITEIKDNRRVKSVEFEELKDINYIKTITPYKKAFSGISKEKLKSYVVLEYFNGGVGEEIYRTKVFNYFYLNFDIDIDKWSKNIELSNAIITFDDGSKTKVNIGKLIFYKDDYMSREMYELYDENNIREIYNPDNQKKTVSSTGKIDYTAYTSKDLLIKDVSFLLYEDLKDLVKDINIDGTSYDELIGIKLKKDNIINLNMVFEPLNDNSNEDIISKFSYYEFLVDIICEDEDLNKYRLGLEQIRHSPHFLNEENIIKYLKARGEI